LLKYAIENGYWLGKNGKDIIPEYGVSGADVFRNAIKIMHPTYVGFHGCLGNWLAIRLFDIKSEKSVELGLKENLKDKEYFLIKKITL